MNSSQIGRLAWLGSAVLSLSACGTLYKLDVTAHNDASVELGNTYVIASGDPDLSVRSPEFAIYADQLERALADSGYLRLPEEQLTSADMAIYLSADVDAPTKTYYQANRQVYETGPDDSPVRGSRGPSSDSSSPVQQQANRIITASEAPPEQELIGNEELPFERTVYTKRLSIVAVDLQAYLKEIAAVGRADASRREIWSVDVTTTGSPSDLQEVVPVMIAAARPYIGTSTEDDMLVKMSGTDKRVAAIKANR